MKAPEQAWPRVERNQGTFLRNSKDPLKNPLAFPKPNEI